MKNDWTYNSLLLALTGTNFFTPGKEIFAGQEIKKSTIERYYHKRQDKNMIRIRRNQRVEDK